MEHPLVVDPDDPLVRRIRGICLAFPEAAEVRAWGRPTFRAGKKIFALVGAGMERPHDLVFKPDPEERLALVQDSRFYLPPYWGPSGWLAIGLDRDDLDWTELAELIDTSYRQVALKRQIRELDGSESRRGAGLPSSPGAGTG